MDSNFREEPTVVYPEKLFEMALRNLIQASVKAQDLTWAVPRFGLDIAAEVRYSTSSPPAHIEIEAKSYRWQRQNGVGFGTKKGGAQVDLLLSSADQLKTLEMEVRWAFVDATQPRGAPRYALLTCSEARNAAMAGVVRGKQNNFSVAALRAHWTVWPAFCEDLRAFLCRA